MLLVPNTLTADSNISQFHLIYKKIDELNQARCGTCKDLKNCTKVAFVGFNNGNKIFYDIYFDLNGKYIVSIFVNEYNKKIIKNLNEDQLFDFLDTIPHKDSLTNVRLVPSRGGCGC